MLGGRRDTGNDRREKEKASPQERVWLGKEVGIPDSASPSQ